MVGISTVGEGTVMPVLSVMAAVGAFVDSHTGGLYHHSTIMTLNDMKG